MKAKLFGLLSLLIAWPVFGQIRDLNITGAGARAEGLGGAFIGVADDATAIVWNPAGLTQLEKPEGSIVVKQYFDGFKSSNSVNSDWGISNTAKHFNLNFISAVYPFELGKYKLTAAVAYQSQVDLYIFQKGNENEDIDEVKQTGGINTISPSVGFRFSPFFSIGLTSNIWFGSSKYRGIDAQTGGTYGFNDDWSGFNLQAGTMMDFSAINKNFPLKAGLSFRTPFKMTDKWHNYGQSTRYKWLWDIPMMAGAGLSYRFGENFTLAADYELRAFGSSKIKRVNDKVYLTDHKKDLLQIRVGAEYLLVTSAAVIPLRAGFRTQPTLYTNYKWDDVNNRYAADGMANGYGFSLGTGYIHPRFAIDVAYSRVSFDQKYDASNTIYGVYKYSHSKNVMTLSTIVYF